MENSVTSLSVEKLVQFYEEYETNTQSARDDSEKNRDYYDNKQWTEEEVKKLNERNQPVITFNLVKRTIDALLGVERQNRTDPKALPRTPQHEKDADACTDALRYVVDNNDFDQIASEAFENLLLEGSEGADIQVTPKGDSYEVSIYLAQWDRMFWDVHSRKRDFSDAKYKGIVLWMDYDDARAKHNWDKDALESAISNSETHTETFDDKPRYKWNDSTRKRIKVCYIYYQHNGKWFYAYYTKGAMLQSGVSPYLDEDGEPSCAFEFQSAFIDRDGNRYGYATILRSPQDEVNKRRSKALHLITQRQTFGNQSIGIDAHHVKQEMAKPDGHIEMQHGEFGKDFGIIPTTDMAQGNFNLLQEAKEAFNVVGANTSVTGKEDRVMSGRAEIVRQQAGMRELSPVLDAHAHWKKRVYRQIWNRIRQFWKEERWVRVTDDQDNIKFIGLNQPITLGEQLQEEYKEDQQSLQVLMSQYQGDPRLNQQVGVRHQVSELDVDILIEESPDVATIQEELFNNLLEIAKFRPEVPFEALIQASPLRSKDKDSILEKIQGDKEMQAMAAQKAAEHEEIEKAGKVADIEKTRSETAKNESQAINNMMDAQNVAVI